MKHLRLLLIFFYSVANAQGVFNTVGSWQEYEAFRSQYRYTIRNSSHTFEAIKVIVLAPDFTLHRTPRRMYFEPDTNSEIEIIEGKNRYYQSDKVLKKPFLKYFYKDGFNLFSSEKKDQYALVINPVIHFEGGSNDSGMVWTNKRGAEIYGNIGGLDRGVGFYTYATDNQALLPYPYQYFTDSLNFVPNELFYKKFKKGGAVDYFQARGYITFNAVKNYIKFQFGHDRNKIGCGYRSMILSDFAPQYLFLKVNTDVGRFHYQNLFTQFTDNGPVMSNVLYGKKYGAFHRLSYNPIRNLHIGLNEMVIFDRMDSTQMNQYDLNYLNPVIFYRAVESNLGSRDNSMIALDANYMLRNKYHFYMQLVLDEFNLKFLKNQPDWWGNKYGYQIGARAFDLFKVYNLDVLLEYNRARPFTYSHMRPTQSFSHFNQALAHPLGSNFAELVSEIKYLIKGKFGITTTITYAKMGRDSFLNGRNYGSNILRPYTTRFSDNGSVMYVGKEVQLLTANLALSYMIKHNIFFDFRLNYRKITGGSNTTLGVGLRINCDMKAYDY